MSASYDIVLSQVLCQRLLQQQARAKDVSLGYVFGRVSKGAIQCTGCALDNNGVLLSFGYDVVGVFCISNGQSENQIYELCQPLVIKYQEESRLKGNLESVVLVYTTPASKTAVFTRMVSLETEAPCEARAVSVVPDTLSGTCNIRARAALRLPFEMDSDAKYLRKNVEVAVARLKRCLLGDVAAFQLEGSGALMRRSSPEKTLQDLVDQSGDGGRRRRSKDGQDVLNFTVLIQSTGDAAVENCGKTCTPVIHYQRKTFQSASVVLPLDVVATVGTSDVIPDVVDLLTEELANQLDQMASCLAKFTKVDHICVPEAYHFFPSSCGHWVTIIYPAGVAEDSLAVYRKEVHRLLLLPEDRPIFRRANRHIFPEDLAGEPYLRNTHLGLSSPPGCEVRLVWGQYAYHHYMQDRVDDSGWGCAYRSLQTLVSWFRMQGYTEHPVPSHREIQQALVDVGDKPASFVGSRQWIGSQEVGYCLNKLLEVESRTVFVSSGSELPTKGRELLKHFEFHGTPIMIGGGMLAHTIIGVAFNEKSGETHYLVLDPHYTGGEDLNTIQNKGWCGWKGSSFWDQNSFYNLCLPQRPIII